MNKHNDSKNENKPTIGKAFKTGVGVAAVAGATIGVFATDDAIEPNTEPEDLDPLATENANDTTGEVGDESTTEQETNNPEEAETLIAETSDEEIASSEPNSNESSEIDFDQTQSTIENSIEEPSIATSEIVGTEAEFINDSKPTLHDISPESIVGQQIDVTPENNPFNDGVAFSDYTEENDAATYETDTEIAAVPETEPSITTEAFNAGDENFVAAFNNPTNATTANIAGQRIDITPENNPFADGIAYTEYIDDATIATPESAIADAPVEAQAYFGEDSITDKIIAGEFIDPTDIQTETEAVIQYGNVETAYNEDGSIINTAAVHYDGSDAVMHDVDGDGVFDIIIDDANNREILVSGLNLTVGDALVDSANNDMDYFMGEGTLLDDIAPFAGDDIIDPSMA